MARPFNTIGIQGDLDIGAEGSLLSNYNWVGVPGTMGPVQNRSIAYYEGSIVVYQDTMYVALIDNDNVEPGQATAESRAAWEALGESNVVHEWNERDSYQLGSLVYRRSGGLATNPALFYYAEVDIPSTVDPAPGNPAPEGNPMVPLNMEDGMPFDPPRMQAQWLSVGGGAARLTASESNGPFPVIKSVSDADAAGVRTVSYEFTELQDANGDVIFGTAAINFREFREGLGIPSDMLAGSGQSVESSAVFTFSISEAGNDFSDPTLVANFTADGGEENRLTRTDNGQQITLSYQMRDNQIDTNLAPFISVESTHVVDNAIFNSGDGIKLNVEGSNITWRADVRENSMAFTNTLEINESGMFVAPYQLSAMNNTAGDMATLNIAGGAGVTSSINVLTNAIATTEASASSIVIDATDDGDLRVSAPPVASWAQTQEGNVANVNSIIPASKLPNMQFGSTHTFDSSSHGSSEAGVIRVRNEFVNTDVEDLVVSRAALPEGDDATSVIGFPAIQAATPLTAFFAGQSDYIGGPATLRVTHHQGANTVGVVEQPLTPTRFISSGFAAETGGVTITRLTPGADYAAGTRLGWTRAGGSNDNDVTVRADGPDAQRLIGDIANIGLARSPNGIFLDSAPFTTTPSAEQVALQLAAGFQMPLGFANLDQIDTIPPFSFGVSGPVGSAANGNPYENTNIQWQAIPNNDAFSVQIIGDDAPRAALDLIDATRGAGGRVIINSVTGQTGFEGFGEFLDAHLISTSLQSHDIVVSPETIPDTPLTRWYTAGVPTINPEVSGEITMTTSSGETVRANPASLSRFEVTTLYRGNREGFTDLTTRGLSTARQAINTTPYAAGTFIGWIRNSSTRSTIQVWGVDAIRVQTDLVNYFNGSASRRSSALFLSQAPSDVNDRDTYLVNSISQSAATPLTATLGRSFRDAQILSIGERTAIGTRDYVDTTVRWVYEEEIDRLTLLVDGTDAALAQTELNAAVAAANAPGGTPIGAIAISDAAASSRDLTNTFYVNGAGDLAVTNDRAFMPSEGAFDGELLHEVVQNDGEQRNGTGPIAWHPGDLLVLAGVDPDSSDNGVYVFVGADQGDTPVSPLPLPNDELDRPQTYVDPLVPTTDEINASFGFNFRVVLSAATEIGTVVSTYENNAAGERVSNPLGRLNQVNYSAGEDILELVGSTNSTPVQIPLAEHQPDDVQGVTGFINHIKIGGMIYRFGPTPPAPTATMNNPSFGSQPANTFRLYRSREQSLDYDLLATQPRLEADGTTTTVTLTDTGTPATISLGNTDTVNRVEIAGAVSAITPIRVARFFTVAPTGLGTHNPVGAANYVPAVEYSAVQNTDGTTTIMLDGTNADQAQADLLAALTTGGNHRGLAISNADGEAGLIRLAADGTGIIVATLVTGHTQADINHEVFTSTDSPTIVAESLIDADTGVLTLPATTGANVESPEVASQTFIRNDGANGEITSLPETLTRHALTAFYTIANIDGTGARTRVGNGTDYAAGTFVSWFLADNGLRLSVSITGTDATRATADLRVAVDGDADAVSVDATGTDLTNSFAVVTGGELIGGALPQRDYIPAGGDRAELNGTSLIYVGPGQTLSTSAPDVPAGEAVIRGFFEVTNLYTGGFDETVGTGRTLVNTAPYAAGTMIMWQYFLQGGGRTEAVDQLDVTVDGPDASRLQSDLNGLEGVSGIYFDETATDGDFIVTDPGVANAINVDTLLPHIDPEIEFTNFVQTDINATITVDVNAFLRDVNISDINYNTAAVPSVINPNSVLTRTVTMRDGRIAPSLVQSNTVTANVLNTSITSISTTVEGIPGRTTTSAHDIQVNAGNLYDVAGYIYGANGAPDPSGTVIVNGAPQVQMLDTAFVGDLSGGASSLRRTMQFAFPMVDNPRNGQPDVDPATLTRNVTVYRPWGWLSARPGITPDSDAIVSAIGRGSNHFTVGIGSTTPSLTYAAGTFEATVLAPNVADIFWFAVPVGDIGTGTLRAITPSTDGDFGISPIPNATVAVTTITGANPIMYNLYRGAGASRTTSGTLIRVTATSS